MGAPARGARARQAALEQYFIYMNQLSHGDLGNSVVNNKPVLGRVHDPVPGHGRADAGWPWLFAVGVGIPLGRLRGVVTRR